MARARRIVAPPDCARQRYLRCSARIPARRVRTVRIVRLQTRGRPTRLLCMKNRDAVTVRWARSIVCVRLCRQRCSSVCQDSVESSARGLGPTHARRARSLQGIIHYTPGGCGWWPLAAAATRATALRRPWDTGAHWHEHLVCPRRSRTTSQPLTAPKLIRDLARDAGKSARSLALFARCTALARRLQSGSHTGGRLCARDRL
jgi:hypothetical protein